MIQDTETPPLAISLGDEILEEYSTAVHQSFLAAASRARKLVERDYRIGGHIIRLITPSLRVADKMGTALAHLGIEAQGRPELTVCLWDGVDPNTHAIPPAPWAWYSAHHESGRLPEMRVSKYGELLPFCNARFYTAFRVGPNKLRALDLHRNLAFSWTEDIERLPNHEFCAPLREILAWWMGAQGQQIVHAGAVGLGHAGVLLAGESGAGKSTTSLSCLGSPLRYAGDDYCLLRAGDSPRVGSLYNSAKLKSDRDLLRFPALRAAVYEPEFRDDEKIYMFLHKHSPQFLSAGFPLKALLMPKIVGHGPTRVEPASSARGLVTLAPSSVRFTPGPNDVAMRLMADFVARVPCYQLRVGSDLRHIPQVILELLERS